MMNKFEKETIINYSKGDKVASISSYDTDLNKRFAQYTKEYPECAVVFETCGDYLRGEILKDRLSVILKPPKHYSPEEKQAMINKITKRK